MIVVDASVVVAAFTSTAADGRWAESIVADDTLAAPHLLPVEVASALRRLVAAGQLSVEAAGLAHDDAVRLGVDLYAYEPVADRVWELRAALSPYDGWYVALAETLDVPLATLDQRLARSHAPGCAVLTPSAPAG